ncbi:probable carboxylesterase 13 [Sorghum bicolor]|uniref:probable carboxylesterase 13 n=1 Tax=Sorghum bicolor TaxID=4558 RepID=UPI000B426AA4|nr:probable carboxylesterase 13 [Sorghum bicolor]|eukprot:XP_021321386.1 probable carboxylesterase 13 [Sorghum bicolor]
MDPDAEVDFDFSPFLIRYKSGRVRRLMGTSRVDADADAASGRASPPGTVAVHSAFSGAQSRFLNALVVAVSVDYRLAPEHPVPATYDDAWTALGWAVASCGARPVRLPTGHGGRGAVAGWAEHGDAARLFVAGDSAGANIAHNVTLRDGGGLPGGARIEEMVHWCSCTRTSTAGSSCRRRARTQSSWREGAASMELRE